MPALVVEASLVAFLVSLPLNSTGVLVPALVIPLFIAGVYLGVRGRVRDPRRVEIVVLVATIARSNDVAVSARTCSPSCSPGSWPGSASASSVR